MHKRCYLESALNEGLLLTDHRVDLSLTKNLEELATSFPHLLALLNQKLNMLGRPLPSLNGAQIKMLMGGLGSISADIPMLCFTEVPEGRDIRNQQILFGAYGLLVRRQWLDQNGADRVVYVGQNSPLSRNLFRVLTGYRIATLFVAPGGEVLFENSCFSDILDLLAYVQTREHLEEFEWRIVGKHGLMGGVRDRNKRLRVGLQDIEYVLVQKKKEIYPFKRLICEIAKRDKPSSVPKILCQPDFIPA